MHEHHAVQNLVNQAVEKAGTKKVTKIRFGLGELVGFDDVSIGLYFDQMTPGTPLEGAVLEIKHYLPKLQCKDCSVVFEDPERKFICPSCSSTSLSLQSGKEFFLESIESE
ncbi:MAG: hydrogenase maturation nickel metallochaperone HypA [Chitinispirillaceae bacterium]|nr:hydrogenase maturation nickel metallochaperone HypA [Chitinispirillaceae bacterium]